MDHNFYGCGFFLLRNLLLAPCHPFGRVVMAGRIGRSREVSKLNFYCTVLCL